MVCTRPRQPRKVNAVQAFDESESPNVPLLNSQLRCHILVPNVLFNNHKYWLSELGIILRARASRLYHWPSGLGSGLGRAVVQRCAERPSQQLRPQGRLRFLHTSPQHTRAKTKQRSRTSSHPPRIPRRMSTYQSNQVLPMFALVASTRRSTWHDVTWQDPWSVI